MPGMVCGALPAFSPIPRVLPPAGQRRRQARAVQVRAKVDFSENVWGVGSGPVFRVVSDSGSGRLDVRVDEEEILVRCGFQSMFSKKAGAAEDRISKAWEIARGIEQGRIVPPAANPLFEFVNRGEVQRSVTVPAHGGSARGAMVASQMAGLIGGLSMAVASYVISRWKEIRDAFGQRGQRRNPVLEGAKPVDEEKITRIQGMAREVHLDEEEAEKDVEKSVPPPLQYAAAARAEILKQQQQARQSEAVTLARRLGEVRRHGEGETLPDVITAEVGSSESLSTGIKMEDFLNGASASASGADDEQAIEVSGVPKRVMPRIITSYKEACEVLASRKSMDRKVMDATADKLVPAAPRTEGLTPAPDSGEKHGWMNDDVLDILVKTRRNDLEGKDFFHGLPPDAKDILFKGLDEDLREDEAEQFKAWVNQRTAFSTPEAPPAREEDTPLISTKPDIERQLVRPQRKTTEAAVNKKKVWPKELQRRYDRETSPKMRKLLKEFGKDLDHWIPEEVLDADFKLYQQGTEGKRELLRRWLTVLKEEARQKGKAPDDIDDELSRFDKLQEKMDKHAALFGKEDLANKMSDFKPRKQNTLWWLDLRYVACIMVRNDDQKVDPGLYSMNMAIDEEKETKMHVVGFEEQSEARNFCRILVPELDKLGGSTGVAVVPFEPKDLLNEVRSTEFEITVLKKGQVELYAGKQLEEVEARIYEVGRDVYVQERLRERSVDIKAALKDFERDL